MFYLHAGAWHCDCGNRLEVKDQFVGQCDRCRAAGRPAPSEQAVELVRAGRVLDMRDDRWQTGCPR